MTSVLCSVSGKFHFCIPLITQRWCGAHISQRDYSTSSQHVHCKSTVFVSCPQKSLTVRQCSGPPWKYRELTFLSFIFSPSPAAHHLFIFHPILSLLLPSHPSVLLVGGQVPSINGQAINWHQHRNLSALSVMPGKACYWLGAISLALN